MIHYFKKLYKDSITSFHDGLKQCLIENKKMFIVTANPETFITAARDINYETMLCDNNTTVVPDGIGIVKSAHYLGYDVKDRLPGVEIAETLLKYGNELHKSIYLYGSKQEVLDKFIEVLHKDYPSLVIAGMQNGYVEDKDSVFYDIKEKHPDIILVAMGIPTQEKLIYQHINEFDKGIFVGVGGSLDVLSGTKKRAPKIFIDLNIEWMYRILKEPKRMQRFFKNNMKFAWAVYKLKRGKTS